MAFHVACPITCRKICFCLLGFPRNLHGGEVKDVFLNEIHSLQELLRDPWDVGISNDGTVQIHVPKLDIFDTGPHIAARDVTVTDGSVMEVVASSLSTLAKRTTLHKKEAENQAANSCSGDLAVSFKELNGEDHDHHGASITCHMCYLVEVERSERAARMLSCKSCGKKYHRSCVKSWAKHRDLFNWSSWSCPSCRACEACGNLGDPKKLMFCKRCDDAYHCDCQQPRHKNASSGPYLCPKHTKCFSCASTVPGNGQSLRWFLGHTCCDACGRLFVKGNYCPVCLKVYRDSESTPMVCCDFCQRWVHCHCDGISDEKYLRFQVDGNLQYKCATCRGECYQIKDLDDAVQEIWKRKDMADKELIASLRASAGFPTEDKMLSTNYSSDDGINGSLARRSSKPTIKVLVDKSQNSSTKKHSKKKASRPHGASNSEVQHDCGGSNYAKSNGYGSELGLQEKSVRFARIVGHTGGTPPISQPGFLEGKDAGKAMVSDEEEKPLRVLRIKSSRPQESDNKSCGKHSTESNTVKAKKLVISIGPRNAGVQKPLTSDISKLSSNGKHRKQQSEETILQEQQRSLLVKNNEEKRAVQAEEDTSKDEVGYIRKHSESKGELRNDHSGSHGLQKDSRCLLKLKIKTHNPESKNGEAAPAPNTVDEKASSAKGHRSKRKRASSPMEKSTFNEDEDMSLSREDSLLDEMLDASWILKKLGKDAKGKKVQIHDATENTWEKGVVSEVAGGGGTSKLMVTMENGKVKNVELGKQGVRFVSEKQKRTKT